MGNVRRGIQGNKDNTFKEKWNSSWKGMLVGEMDDAGEYMDNCRSLDQETDNG